jgi:hypothetical protein
LQIIFEHVFKLSASKWYLIAQPQNRKSEGPQPRLAINPMMLNLIDPQASHTTIF